MDLDKSFVASIVQGGKDALRIVIDRGITAELLQGDGREAFQYIHDHYSKYGEIPGFGVLAGKLGISIEPVIDSKSVEFYANTVFERDLSFRLAEGLKSATELLEKHKPVQAFESLQELLFLLHRLNLGDSKVTSIFALGKDVVDYYNRMKAGERGILTPWSTVNDNTLGFGPEELILFAARSGIGKCVESSSTCVDPKTGVLRTIQEVVENSDLKSVYSWDRTHGVHSRQITNKVDTGYKRCLEFTFSSGRSVVVTPEHPLLTAEGWKRADEFKVGMTAALAANIPFPTEPVSLPRHYIDTLALMLADGSCTAHDTSFTKSDPIIVQIAREAAETFGLELKSVNGVNSWRFSGGKGNKSNKIKDWLRSIGLDGVLSKNKKIPDDVFRLPSEDLSRFLSVFWMCDGYVTKTGLGVTLASKALVTQLQHLLLRFGIQSKVGYKPARCGGKRFDSWRLRVYSFCLEKFSKVVHLWGHKKDSLMLLVNKDRNTNVGYPRVSKKFVAAIKAVAATKAGVSKGSGLVKVARLLGRSPAHAPGKNSYLGARDLFGKHNSLRLRPFAAFCEVYGLTSEYEWLWDSDLFWDVVVNIEDVGIKKIYDLTVEPTSCFVANDVVVHNTWVAILLAKCAWEAKKKVLFVTTEMSKLRIALRFYSILYKLPYGQFRAGKLNSFAENSFLERITQVLSESGLDLIGGNFDFRTETIGIAIDDCKPDIVIIDGIYLLKAPGQTRTEKLANVFDEIKRLTVHKKLPVVVTSQFNREVKVNQASTARMESVALTDAAVWHSTLIFGLVQTDDMKEDKRMMIKQLKIRDGTGGDVELNWDFDKMDFSELPKDPATAASGGDVAGGDLAGVEDLAVALSTPDSNVPF